MRIEEFVGGEGEKRITRAVEAYRSWASDDPVEAVAPADHILRRSGENDAAVIELLREHDPLGSGTPEFAVADLVIDPDAVVLAELLVAASIATQTAEAPGKHKQAERMQTFVWGREYDIEDQIGLRRFGTESVLAGLVADWSEAQRLLLLIEATASNPFAPYELAWNADYELAALAHLATVIGLPARAAHDVASTFSEATAAHQSISYKRAGLYGLGAAAAQNEIIKLQVTYKLILVDLQRNDAAAHDVLATLEQRIAMFEGEIDDHLAISDPDSPRVQELQETLANLRSADDWMTDCIDDHGSLVVGVHSLAARIGRLEANMASLGRNSTGPDIDALRERFTPQALTTIEDRMRCRFSMAVELDRWDVIAAIGAGIVAAAVDAFIVGDPRNPITTRLRDGAAVRGGNWLEDLAKVPYDISIGSGLTPNNHRVATFGHDPLVGLVLGTRDIINSTMTRSDMTGAVQFIDRPTVDGSATLLTALGTQVAHLLSDVATPAGLPLPGWSVLTGAPATADDAVRMYTKGYDTWHLAPMTVPVAAVHTVSSAYWALRPDRADLTNDERDAFTLLALGIASVGDLAAMLATGANPLALNYVMWLELARRTAKDIRRRSQRSALVTLNDAQMNQHLLNHGWSVLLGA